VRWQPFGDVTIEGQPDVANRVKWAAVLYILVVNARLVDERRGVGVTSSSDRDAMIV